MKVGFIGSGRIVSNVARALIEDGHEVAFTMSRRGNPSSSLPGTAHLASLPSALELAGLDLVIEAASPSAVGMYGPEVLPCCDFCILSTTALRDAELLNRLRSIEERSRQNFSLLSGGIIGVDGLRALGPQLLSVEIETVKPPAMWGLEDHPEVRILFEGSTRQACALYERNVNVHATVAFYSIGFDRCSSRLVSHPAATAISQRVRVVGQDFGWEIDLHSKPIGGVTGSLTPRMVLHSVRQILLEKGRSR